MSRADQRQWSDGAAGPALRAVPDAGWWDHAACRDEDPSLFFPERGGSETRKARAICARCPVRPSCLAFALGGGQWGVWGGELFEAGRLIPQPPRVGPSPSCRNGHERTAANTHIGKDQIRCLDCERDRAKKVA